MNGGRVFHGNLDCFCHRIELSDCDHILFIASHRKQTRRLERFNPHVTRENEMKVGGAAHVSSAAF